VTHLVAPLSDLAAALHQLADVVEQLDVAEIVGKLEALKFAVATAAAPAPAPTGPVADPCALLTDAAVAELLGLPTRTVVRLRQRGDLPGVAVGDKYVRTRRRDLERYVASLPASAYSRKYADKTHARLSSPTDGRCDAAPAPSPARLDAGRSRRGARRDE
jgi:excisionase family DNA binding protein